MNDVFSPEIVGIVAATQNGVIGRSGGMPFRLKSDMQHFRRTTMGHPVVMGRKTWETLPKPLEGRHNIVMTRRGASADFEGASVASSTEEVLELCADDDIIMIMGGGEIYRLWLPMFDRLVFSLVDAELEGDTIFPDLSAEEWVVAEEGEWQQGPDDDYRWKVVDFRRRGRGREKRI